jgi:hypothetical protein
VFMHSLLFCLLSFFRQSFYPHICDISQRHRPCDMSLPSKAGYIRLRHSFVINARRDRLYDIRKSRRQPIKTRTSGTERSR